MRLDGAGSSPLKVFTELALAQHILTGDPAEWEDLDLSAEIAAGAKFAEIVMTPITGALDVGVRKNGSAIERKRTLPPSTYLVMIVQLDSSRIIEAYNPGGASQCLYMCSGYWS